MDNYLSDLGRDRRSGRAAKAAELVDNKAQEEEEQGLRVAALALAGRRRPRRSTRTSTSYKYPERFKTSDAPAL